MMAMMILKCISGTSRSRGLNGIRVLMLLLISEAHRMASHGSWTYILQARDLKRDWLLSNSSSNSPGKAQLGRVWSDTYPYKDQLCSGGLSWGKDCDQSMFFQHGGVHGHDVHAGYSQKKGGGWLLGFCIKGWLSVMPSKQALKSPLPLSRPSTPHPSLPSFLSKLPIKKIRYF